MCADAPHVPWIPPEPRTPGERLDAKLAELDRENAALRSRMHDIEREADRLRRAVRDAS